ncbi:MAG: major facilitator superfamily 1 [Thermomicrobiales bacterium]|nr:major facilitator superfamily 1 [Thermomicrobiales bacterium]
MMALEKRSHANRSHCGVAPFVIGPDQASPQLTRVAGEEPAAAQEPVATYAWVVVSVVAIILTIASGARFLFGVVLKPISEEFSWNRAQLTGAVMLAMIVLSIFQPLVGILVDRIGAKKILVGGVALLGVSLIPLSFATSLWQIYILYGVLTSIGLAAASPVLVTSIVGRWFTRNRGLAMSVATSGSAFGQLLIVPVATWIMLVTSWQTTYRVLAVALLAVALPLGMYFLRDAPRTAAAAGKAPLQEDGLTLRDAIAHPAFWILAFGFFVCGWTMAFPNTHYLAYADDMGMSLLHAANTISATAIFSIVGSVLLGLAADRFRRTSVLALTYVLRGLAFLLLLLLPAGNLLYVYGLVLGISWTATTPLTAAIAADRYGPKHLGFIFGSLFTFMNLGSGFGSFLGGVIFEATGGYQVALIVNVALGVAAAVAAALVPQFGHERQRQQSVVTAPDTGSLPARASR